MFNYCGRQEAHVLSEALREKFSQLRDAWVERLDKLCVYYASDICCTHVVYTPDWEVRG